MGGSHCGAAFFLPWQQCGVLYRLAAYAISLFGDPRYFATFAGKNHTDEKGGGRGTMG